MKPNIVYLFGAGASYNALPIYKDFVERMDMFIDYIKKNNCKLNATYNEAYKEIRNFKTPDTYAAALTLRKKETDLNILKTLLTFFFGYEQIEKDREFAVALSKFHDKNNPQESLVRLLRIQNIIDPRYISFLSTICLHIDKSTKVFPDNIQFLTWNYDSQLELAYSKIFQKKLPLNGIRKEMDVARIGHPSGRLIKLNGSADFNTDDRTFFDLNQDDLKKFEESLKTLEAGESINTLINFGFGVYDKPLEDDTEENRFIRKIRYAARQRLKRADIVVIVGYSFPDFNRRIDKSIFLDIRDDVRIYVQDINANQVIQKLNGVKTGLSNKAQAITNVDQFWIPYDFWE